MMVSSTTDFRLLKAEIRSRKGRGNKVLGSPPEQEPLTACCLEQCWLPRAGAFVRGFVGSIFARFLGSSFTGFSAPRRMPLCFRKPTSWTALQANRKVGEEKSVSRHEK